MRNGNLSAPSQAGVNGKDIGLCWVGDRQQSLSIEDRVYKNNGNHDVVRMIPSSCKRILDIGCGAGDNAALVRERIPGCEIVGITRSESEAERARRYMTECWVENIEGGIPEHIRSQAFDCIVFSHVLEHLVHPAAVVARMTRLLSSGGRVVIAVPNVLFFKVRMQFLLGKFEYQPGGGILDDTHLHFYTYFTASSYLLSQSPDLRVVGKLAPGHFPFGGMRGRLIPHAWSELIDSWAGRNWPNLFGRQIVLAAEKI